MPDPPKMFRSRRRRRPTSAERGYDRQWREQQRAEQLERAPWCRHCLERGESVRATVADHIIPRRRFAPSEHDQADDFTNLQSLCRDCHRRKTAAGR